MEWRGVSSTSSSSEARRPTSRSSSSKSSPSHSRSSAFKYLFRCSANVTRWTSRTGARPSPRDRQPDGPVEVAVVWPLTSHSLAQPSCFDSYSAAPHCALNVIIVRRSNALCRTRTLAVWTVQCYFWLNNRKCWLIRHKSVSRPLVTTFNL